MDAHSAPAVAPDVMEHLPACGPRCVAHCLASPSRTADYTLAVQAGGKVTSRRNRQSSAPRPAWTLAEGFADLATLILARGDVRAHPSQADLRRKLRGAMEAEAKPLLVMYGFRFSLGNGALFSYQGLPLCVRVEDVDKWRAMTAKPRRKSR
jgi:hypothetical protein